MKSPYRRCFFLVYWLFLFTGVMVVDAKIVFTMGGDIYVMNDDGSNRRQLTKNTESSDHQPRWSPDGKRIAFYRYMTRKRQITSELFIMNANGTDLQRLTDNNVSDFCPSWSPDGQYLVFDSRRSKSSEVHVIELATLAVTQLTGLIDPENENEMASVVPDWSPDGTQIVYEKFIRRGLGVTHKNIYVMSADGTQQRPLLPDPPFAEINVIINVIMRFEPRWSADGQRILFDDCTWPPGGDQQCKLTVKELDGKTQVITGIYDKLGDEVLTSGLSWMENDRALLFGLILLDKPNPNYDLYKYVLKTGRLERLTQGVGNERDPDWREGPLSVSPQGKKKVQWGTLKK